MATSNAAAESMKESSITSYISFHISVSELCTDGFDSVRPRDSRV